jgi:multimeric flavodoxin WrbA
MKSKKISIIYHSSSGSTEKVALAISKGAKISDITVYLIKAENISQKDWKIIDSSDAIIFGTPTYMGGVSAQFKIFIDAASKKWAEQKWKDKIAAGFTNSGSYSGDKLSALQQLMINALQHGMIWVGQAELPPKGKGKKGAAPSDINRLGSFTGLMTQSNREDFSPPPGDMATARIFGRRIAEITKRFN